MLLAGGPIMIPIVLASFLMVLIVFERLISLRRRKVVPRLFVRAVSAAASRRRARSFRGAGTLRRGVEPRCPRVCGGGSQMG